MCGNGKRTASELLRAVDICNPDKRLHFENNRVLALLLPTADREDILLSQFHMAKAVIMMGIIVLAGVDLNLLCDSGSHPS